MLFNMRISIITVCYNRVGTIEKAIQSVLKQDYTDIEYIVIDGNSTDGTNEIIEKYKDRITHYVSETDKGMYDALNKGLALSTGDIVGLMHSDDEFYDNYVLSKIAETFEQRAETDCVYGNGIYISNNNEEKIIRNRICGDFTRSKIENGWLPLHTTVYLKRVLLDEFGFYDLRFKIASDTEFLLRYLYKQHIIISYLNMYIVKMRFGGLSTSKSRAFQVLREDYLIYKFHGFSAFKTVLQKKFYALNQYLKSKS